MADLEQARKALAKINAAIDRKMRRQFLVVFDKVNANFSEIFSMLFPGGKAHLEMTDPDHLDETGVEIVAQPQGKRIQKMTLMSGGEKSLTALAFSLLCTRRAPCRSTCSTRSRRRSTARTSPSCSTRSRG